MKPEPRVFTRDAPCTKREIWECFRRAKGFIPVQVDTARAIIGLNVPRVMERNERLTVESTAKGDFYRLTPAGEQWLTQGIQSYVRNHPAEAGEIPYLPVVRRVSRTRRRG